MEWREQRVDTTRSYYRKECCRNGHVGMTRNKNQYQRIISKNKNQHLVLICILGFKIVIVRLYVITK